MLKMPYGLVNLTDKVRIPFGVPPDYFIPKLLERISNYLKSKAYIHNVEIKENFLDFKAPPFRFSWNGFNLFNPVSNGQIWVELGEREYEIYYRIWFLEFFTYSVIFSTISVYGMFPNLQFRILYLFLVWALYIFHTIWVKNRLESFIERISSEIAEEYFDMLERLKGDAEG